MQGGVVELAREAAAAARAERGAARLPVRRSYRGVMRRGDLYVAEIMDAAGLRPVCLGLYATPEEAAYAYDAAARIMHGNNAKPNFPPLPAAAWGGGGGVARAVLLRPLVGHARMRVAINGQQAPVGGGGGAQRQAFFAQQAPPAPYFLAPPPVPYQHGGAVPAFSQFLYHPAAGPVFAAAGGSNGVGFYVAGPLFAAAGGSNGGAGGFYAAGRPALAAAGGSNGSVGGFYAAGPALATTGGSNGGAGGFNAADPALAATGGSNGGAGGFYAADPELAAAGGSNEGAGGFYDMAPMIGPEPEVPIPTYAASSPLSSSDKKNKDVVDADLKLKLAIIIESDGKPMIQDNISPRHGGVSTSSAARPAVPPLRLKDLMESEVVRRIADEGAP